MSNIRDDVKITVTEEGNIYPVSRVMASWLDLIRIKKVPTPVAVKPKEYVIEFKGIPVAVDPTPVVRPKKYEVEFEVIPVYILNFLGFDDILYNPNGLADASIKGFRFFGLRLAVMSKVKDFIDNGEIKLVVGYDRRVKL